MITALSTTFDIKKLCNDYVTNVCNTNRINPTRAQMKFIKKGLEINVIRKCWWSYHDFVMTDVNFRQMVHRLKKIIIKEINSRPAFYRFKEIDVPGSVTKMYTGVDTGVVSIDFEKLLLNLKHQPPQMHDIRLEAFTNLHEKLQLRGFKPNKNNNAYTIDIPISSRFTTKVNVYSNKMQVMIGCSQNPICYDIDGFQDLTFYLGQVYHYLMLRAGSNIVVQPISKWIVKYYHFNRDGLTLSSPVFNYTIEDLGKHSILYMKHFKDGTVHPRYEEHRTPNKSLAELEEEAANEAFCS